MKQNKNKIECTPTKHEEGAVKSLIQMSKETSLDLFDSDFIEMSYNGVKMVFSQITYLYVKNLHDTGRMSDEEYNAIMAHAGQKPQGKAKVGE